MGLLPSYSYNIIHYPRRVGTPRWALNVYPGQNIHCHLHVPESRTFPEPVFLSTMPTNQDRYWASFDGLGQMPCPVYLICLQYNSIKPSLLTLFHIGNDDLSLPKGMFYFFPLLQPCLPGLPRWIYIRLLERGRAETVHTLAPLFYLKNDQPLMETRSFSPFLYQRWGCLQSTGVAKHPTTC